LVVGLYEQFTLINFKSPFILGTKLSFSSLALKPFDRILINLIHETFIVRVLRVVTCKTRFDLGGWIYCTLHSYISGLQALQRYRRSRHFTVHRYTSVFTSRILATDLQQSRCHFKLHIKSSLYRLISFLPLFCNCQFRRLDSIQFLCSQTHTL
jgi:hypothetical protein